MDGNTLVWRRWLVAVTLIVFAFGIALVLFPGTMQRFFERLYFTPRAGTRLQLEAATYAAFLQGVLGAVMAGWAVLLLFILRGPFRRCEASAWNMIALSLSVWFVLDTALSLLAGFWRNAVLNGALFAAFAIPLAATYRRFHLAEGEGCVLREGLAGRRVMDQSSPAIERKASDG